MGPSGGLREQVPGYAGRRVLTLLPCASAPKGMAHLARRRIWSLQDIVVQNAANPAVSGSAQDPRLRPATSVADQLAEAQDPCRLRHMPRGTNGPFRVASSSLVQILALRQARGSSIGACRCPTRKSAQRRTSEVAKRIAGTSTIGGRGRRLASLKIWSRWRTCAELPGTA